MNFLCNCLENINYEDDLYNDERSDDLEVPGIPIHTPAPIQVPVPGKNLRIVKQVSIG